MKGQVAVVTAVVPAVSGYHGLVLLSIALVDYTVPSQHSGNQHLLSEWIFVLVMGSFP